MNVIIQIHVHHLIELKHALGIPTIIGSHVKLSAEVGRVRIYRARVRVWRLQKQLSN